MRSRQVRLFVAPFLSALFTYLFLQSVPACDPVRVPQSPDFDAYGIDANDTCAQACALAASCNCPAGENPRCAFACRLDQAQGAASQLDPVCVIAAHTCSDIAACGMSCP